MIVFYWVVKAILGPILRLVFRPWVDGAENVPREGGAILASNHLSFSDHFFAPLPLPRKVVFLAKSEYFTGRGLKGLVKRAFFRGVGQIPVDRSGGQASERALRTGLRVLAQGQLLGIYPEGTRTPDGRLYRGKTGVARLALEAKVPVVPTAMVGTFEFQPPGKIAPRLWVRPGVRFGKPLDFSRYYGLHEDRIVLRAITDEIMYELMKLAGQEYVDEYAQRTKTRRLLGRKNPDARKPATAGDPDGAIPADANGGAPTTVASGTALGDGTGSSGSGAANGAGGDAGTVPGGDAGTVPGGDAGTAPGGDAGTAPGGDAGTVPGGDAGTVPGSPEHPARDLDGGRSVEDARPGGDLGPAGDARPGGDLGPAGGARPGEDVGPA